MPWREHFLDRPSVGDAVEGAPATSGLHLPRHSVAASSFRCSSGWRGRLRSLRFAAEGLSVLFRDEPNARVHIACAAIACVLGLLLRISLAEWRWVILAIGLVLAAEAVNTALERACDAAHPDPHPLVKAAKDLSAAAVLIVALTAFAIGLLTFLPPLARTVAPLTSFIVSAH
ncbi:diacylglycerol kinase family protein [Sphingosinicella terrae]|uniref:diacylglycerol kinase family protein n=1 Tax=Sphingosinicella terrae TaxID=2172047 RepID=UPI000E0D563E|nr:diacylglycerol kinase family protein [Sphingosinicella terrae]